MQLNAALAPQRQSGLRVSLAYALARYLIARRQAQSHSEVDVAADWKTYGDWRHVALRSQFNDHFGADSVKGKDVLDFGCGDGQLCSVLLEAGAASAHGVDVDEKGLARFAERLARDTGERRPTFRRNTTLSRIDEADQSFDVICCLDVLEHISEYRSIIREWYRVLRPGGRVYIWWQPYWHPFGHHAQYWVPIPWVHVFLSNRHITEVCARIVDWHGFDAPVFDRYPDGSRRNRFREPGADGEGFLNKLTVREFERHCHDAGFVMNRRDFYPFSLPQPARAVSALMTKVPIARDFFTSYAIYELVRPE